MILSFLLGLLLQANFPCDAVGATMVWDGTKYTCSVSNTRDTSQFAPVTTVGSHLLIPCDTTAEHILFTYQIPAGVLGTTHALAFNVVGHLPSDAGPPPDLILRVKYGSQVGITIDDALRFFQSEDIPWRLMLNITSHNLTIDPNLQFMILTTFIKATQNANSSVATSHIAFGNTTVDSSIDQTLAVTVQCSAVDPGSAIHRVDVDRTRDFE